MDMLTIKGAQKRIKLLEGEIDYLKILVNSNVRADRELDGLGEAPKSIYRILINQLASREDERNYLLNSVQHHQENAKVINAWDVPMGAVEEGVADTPAPAYQNPPIQRPIPPRSEGTF